MSRVTFSRPASPWLVWTAWVLGAAVLVLYVCKAAPAHARDLGQWQYADPDISAWYKSLKQPDVNVSCCGEADAYWADRTDIDPVTGGLVAIITDTRDDATLKRPHIDVGTRIAVPPNKIRRPALPNPTEHTIIFVSISGTVWCYEPLPGM